MHISSKDATKGLRVIKFVDPTLHVQNCFRLFLQYNLFLLFVICKSLYDSLYKNWNIFLKWKAQ